MRQFLRVMLGSFLLLVISYSVYFIRYPIWRWSVEPVFAALILSYLAVLVSAIFLVEKDLRTSIKSVLAFHGFGLVLVGLILAVFFQGLWYGLVLLFGAKFDFLSFPVLRGFESYTYHSLAGAFLLYVGFSTFGAFAEDVAYKGYVQNRVSAKYGAAIGILVSAVFFSLQHVHVFQLAWIGEFVQGQLVNVLLGGLFGGYFFFRTKGDVWSVFAFHSLGNLFSVSLPINITYANPCVYYVATLASYVVLFGVLVSFPALKKGVQ